MSRAPEVERALGDLRRSHAAGRLAHAYFVVGAPRREAGELAAAVIEWLVAGDSGRPVPRYHPDVFWVEPRSKLRSIVVDDIRALNARLQATAFCGGWKIAVLVGADRMMEAAANAFLKTLEEPAPMTLLLLLTDAPEGVLPTIRSRAQVLHVSGRQTVAGGAWREALLKVLRAGAPRTALLAMQHAAMVDGLMQNEKKRIAQEMEAASTESDPAAESSEEVEDKVLDARVVARALEVQADMLRAMLLWHRDLLVCALGMERELLHFPDEEQCLRQQAQGLAPGQALQTVRIMEEAADRMQRMPSTVCLEGAFLAWGRTQQRSA